MTDRKKKSIRIRTRSLLDVFRKKNALTIHLLEATPREMAEIALQNLDKLIEFNERTNQKSRDVLAQAYSIIDKTDYQQPYDFSV